MQIEQTTFESMQKKLEQFTTSVNKLTTKEHVVNAINDSKVMAIINEFKNANEVQKNTLLPKIIEIAEFVNKQTLSYNEKNGGKPYKATLDLNYSWIAKLNNLNENLQKLVAQIKNSPETKPEEKNEVNNVDENKKTEEINKIDETKKTEDVKKVEETKKKVEVKKVDETKKKVEVKKVDENKKTEEVKKVDETKKTEEIKTIDENKKIEEEKKKELENKAKLKLEEEQKQIKDLEKTKRQQEFDKKDGINEVLKNIFDKSTEFKKLANDYDEENDFKQTKIEGAYTKGDKAATNLHNCMTYLREWYIESKLTKKEFVTCAKQILGNEEDKKNTQTDFDNILNNNEDIKLDPKYNEKKALLLAARNDVNELKEHRGYKQLVTNLFAACVLLLPYLIAAAIKGNLSVFKPETKSGKQANKLLGTIIKEMEEEPQQVPVNGK